MVDMPAWPENWGDENSGYDPSDTASKAGQQYQDGWNDDRVTLPDQPAPSILAAAKALMPNWSPQNSGLNMLVDKGEIHDILAGKDAPSGQALPQPDSGFYTGLQPYVPDLRGPIHAGINQNGYVPQSGDDKELARLIMAEGASTPQDREALGWAVVNRVGSREFGQSLDQVVNKKNAFQSVQENKSLWPQSANPQSFTGPNARAWDASKSTAQGILSGAVPDPTGGATLFFSSKSYNSADPKTAPPGWYPKAIERGDLVPSSSYPATPDRTSGYRNYFFVENPYRK
jgi:hypothetical protein